MTSCLGIDIGGTKIAAVLLDNDSGKELFTYRTDTPKNYPDFLQAVENVIDEVSLHASDDFHVGIGLPGLVFPDRTVLNYNNLPFIKPDFASDLESRINRKVYIANDANCFAFSEYTDGAAQGYNSALCLILGTGVGGGIVINGQIVGGAHALAGEVGHTALPFPSKEERETPCACGASGCIEALVAGPALVRQYNQAAKANISSAAEIVTAAANNNEIAAQVLHTFYERLARAFLSFICTFDPEVIVLGGGLSQIQEIYTEVPKLLSAKMQRFTPGRDFHIDLKPAVHGDSSGVRGAAWLWKTDSL
ncbi:MAG: ROK family protein [Alphaproteobacteria bacterium]|nr:ROK family protein [Alphaproteobacteria bacterium]